MLIETTERLHAPTPTLTLLTHDYTLTPTTVIIASCENASASGPASTQPSRLSSLFTLYSYPSLSLSLTLAHRSINRIQIVLHLKKQIATRGRILQDQILEHRLFHTPNDQVQQKPFPSPTVQACTSEAATSGGRPAANQQRLEERTDQMFMSRLRCFPSITCKACYRPAVC